jgi:hypothetical protein
LEFDRYADNNTFSTFYKPDWEIPALDENQKIGGFENLVLVQKRGKNKAKIASYEFLMQVPFEENV